MRLAGCLVLEATVASALLGAGGFVGARAVTEARGILTTARAVDQPGAVAGHAGGRSVLTRHDDLSSEVGPEGALESFGTFLGMSDELLLERIRTQAVTRLKLNRGGSSLSFRVDFADGSRAAWKPAQTNAQTVPRKEVAAYRLNRLLGLNSVPPATPRAIARDDMFELLHPESASALPRIRAETIVGPNDMVAGAASYWIPVIKDSEFDTPAGRQQMATWLTIGEPIPFERRPFVAQVAVLAVFDFLTANPDRHSGGNMKTSADGSQLFFMDNTMSFFLDPQGTEKNRQVLLKVQRFSRRLHEALGRVDFATLRPLMREANGDEILTDAEIRAVVQRRVFVQGHVADLIKDQGEKQVLCFP
jgi:hypothetical protein